MAGEEIEIKLVGAPAIVAALERSPLLQRLTAGSGSWDRLVSTYYDTPDASLAVEGASLRLRKDAEGLTQTVKLKPPAEGAYRRLEEERPLLRREDFPLPPADPRLAALVPQFAHAAPVARVIADRWTVIIETGGARIEAALDLGRFESLDGGAVVRMAPCAECELELLSGDPAALFDVAAGLIEESAGALRLSLASKSEQLAALGRAPAPVRIKRRLAPGVTVGEAIAASLRDSSRRLTELQGEVANLRLADSARRMRVELRRLRMTARIFRKVAGELDLKELAETARRFTAALAEARDLDVFVDATLAEFRPPQESMGAFDALKAGAADRRSAAWARAAAAIASTEFSLFTLNLLGKGARSPGAASAVQQPLSEFAPPALDRRLRAALKAGDAAAEGDAAARHRFRLSLKKLRYAIQSFSGLYPKERRKPYLATLAALQETLGALNDGDVALRLASEANEGAAVPFIRERIDERVRAGLEEFLRMWRAFKAARPFWRPEEAGSEP